MLLCEQRESCNINDTFINYVPSSLHPFLPSPLMIYFHQLQRFDHQTLLTLLPCSHPKRTAWCLSLCNNLRAPVIEKQFVLCYTTKSNYLNNCTIFYSSKFEKSRGNIRDKVGELHKVYYICPSLSYHAHFPTQ